MIQLYWKNATAEVVGEANGVLQSDLTHLGDRMAAAQGTVAGLVESGSLGYATLPIRRDYRDSVMQLVDKHTGRCSDLVVLGIGGSALGNIALQCE